VSRRRRSRTVHVARSRLSGRIRVVDYRGERRLIVAGEILSVYPLDGDWSRVAREYWWRALAALPLPPRPTALLIGLGGGTQVHLLHRTAAPRLVTIVERDPAIVRVARAWFGLDALGPLELLCAEAEAAVPMLARAGRRFDFVMEDAAYADPPARGRPLALALAGLVSARGVLVVNRHRRSDGRELARLLRPRFERVVLRRVRRGGENLLVCCARPVRRAAGACT
jgi:spermidine synthase